MTDFMGSLGPEGWCVQNGYVLEANVRKSVAEDITRYSNKHHIKHDAEMPCVRCDIAAAYSYAAKIALGEGGH